MTLATEQLSPIETTKEFRALLKYMRAIAKAEPESVKEKFELEEGLWRYASQKTIKAIVGHIDSLEFALAANREAQPVAYAVFADNGNIRICSTDKGITENVGVPVPLYTAPLAPAVPDGYCVMPLTLTASNGAKGALSGEFKVSRTVRCHECGGEGCVDCGDAGEFEEEIIIPWETIKDIYRAAVTTCSTVMQAVGTEKN